MKLFPALSLALAFNCFAAPAPTVDLGALRAAFTTSLKDADTAKFTEIKVRKLDGNLLMICGQVNSKNSFGAYAGFSPFMALAVPPSKGKVISTIATTSIGDAAAIRCAGEVS